MHLTVSLCRTSMLINMSPISKTVREHTRKAVKQEGLGKFSSRAGLDAGTVCKLLRDENRDFLASTLDALAAALKIRLNTK